ncbi:MFS family permease [Catenulispora sp. GP43]|uniref:MFS transporter n=1 Tax=Catenulispora sp. GP43 TaxID=3156263 RepID=UPI003515E906
MADGSKETGRRRLGRPFAWLWSAYTISTLGTYFAFNAFSLILIRVLHSGPAQVAALSASGAAVGALVAVPLGPWVEFRRKRPVMMAMDLLRFGAMLTIPVAYGFGVLSFAQLLAVSVVVGAADITFTAASGAYLRSLLPREDLLAANGRFESAQWSSIVIGPPLGGAVFALLGPVATVVADAVSYLLSALGIRAIGADREVVGTRDRSSGLRMADLATGWRHIFGNPALRPLFLNSAMVNALIMAGEPLLNVLMLGRLGFAPWEYGLAFAVPCLGGLLGSRLAPRLVARYGRAAVLRTAGTLRAVWPLGLPLVGPGLPGLLLVIVVELGLITTISVYNPVLATHRLEQAGPDNVTRILSAWSITSKASIAAATALWGLIAAATSPRFGLGLAGALLLASPLLLPRGARAEALAATS